MSKTTSEIRKRTAGYIITALGLVAGLAWNDAIKSMIESLYPLNGDGVTAKFIYAVVITAIIVFVSMRIQPLAEEEEKKNSHVQLINPSCFIHSQAKSPGEQEDDLPLMSSSRISSWFTSSTVKYSPGPRLGSATFSQFTA